VGDAGRQAANRLELLGLPQIRLDPFAHDDLGRQLSVCFVDRRVGPGQLAPLLIASQQHVADDPEPQAGDLRAEQRQRREGHRIDPGHAVVEGQQVEGHTESHQHPRGDASVEMIEGQRYEGQPQPDRGRPAHDVGHDQGGPEIDQRPGDLGRRAATREINVVYPDVEQDDDDLDAQDDAEEPPLSP
jgi:hypothetical protein